jgi:hypothetical protein
VIAGVQGLQVTVVNTLKSSPLLPDCEANFTAFLSLQVTADAYGTQSVVLQGFFVRGGCDTSSIEAVNNYTLERDSVAMIGGAQFIATLYETKAPSNLIPSTYTVCSFWAIVLDSQEALLSAYEIALRNLPLFSQITPSGPPLSLCFRWPGTRYPSPNL